MRKANVLFLVLAGLVVGFFAAAIAVMQSGDCWRNCDPEYDTVYSVTPLLMYFVAVGIAWTGLCGYLWTRPFRSTTTPTGRVTSGLLAAAATLPLAAVLARVF